MRFLKIYLTLALFVFCQNIHSQAILKIVKNYALIDIDENSGLQINDEVSVLRTLESGKVKTIGTIRLVKYAQGKCAGKIIWEKYTYQIEPGDFLKMPGQTYNAPASLPKSASKEGGTGTTGVEKGDSEISFIGFYMKMVGTGYDIGGTGSFRVSYGYYVSDQFQIGAAPQLLIYQGAFGAKFTIFSLSAFCSYNFNTASKLIPYLTAQWYQEDFSTEYGDFLDDSYITFGGGFRNFFTEYAALNISLSYGFCLGSGYYSNIFTLMSGLSFIF